MAGALVSSWHQLCLVVDAPKLPPVTEFPDSSWSLAGSVIFVSFLPLLYQLPLLPFSSEDPLNQSHAQERSSQTLLLGNLTSDR